MKMYTVIAGALMLGVATPASAQVMTVSQVLSECPDFQGASACPTVTTAFLESRPYGPRTDTEVVNLVLVLAEAAQQPRVTMPVCLDTAEGIRVLARGMSSEAQAQQVFDIADALCLDTTTAAIGGPTLLGEDGNGGGLRLIDQGQGGQGQGGQGQGGQDQGGQDQGGQDQGGQDQGGQGGEGLGSNNAAKSPNQKAFDNADDSAQNNTSGNNSN